MWVQGVLWVQGVFWEQGVLWVQGGGAGGVSAGGGGLGVRVLMAGTHGALSESGRCVCGFGVLGFWG